ncbi:ComEC/Rec2 family competence protein [Pseudoroseomonas globiformis]|uniref:ComEC/Rec2 family competence protein n=1 Tax=Teichococcus globiformis TaxID=2307229 RepID=A0ABV7G1T2_9PROT
MAAEWHRLPLWLPVAMGTGIIAYFSVANEPSAAWWVLPLPLLVAAVALRRRALAAWLLGLAGMASLGFALAGWHAARMPPPLDLPRTAVIVEGLVEAVDMLPKGLRVTLTEARFAPEEPVLPRFLRIRLRADDPLQPLPGERIRLRALIRPPSAPPYPGGWDFQRDAYFSGLGGSGFALGPAERLEGAREKAPFGQARTVLERRVMAVLHGGQGAIAAALLTGSQSGIPDDDMIAMRDSGLAHLLSVSGLHIAIVMGLGFGVVRFMIALVPAIALRWDSKKIAAPGALLLGFGYLMLTGAQVPMQRSFAMAAVVTLGVMLGRRALSLRVLGLAAMIVMAVQPAALLGPSFQMSFAAVLVLIAGAELSGRFMLRWQRGPEWWRRPVVLLAGSVLTSFLAGLATTPYGLHHFGRLQLYGVAANMVAVPLTSFIVMPAGMLAAALMPFGLEEWALRVMGLGVEATLFTARTVASWPGAALTAFPIPPAGLLLATFGLLWLCLWRMRWRWWGAPVAMAGLLGAFFVTPPDMLVSADARLIAFRTEEGMIIQRNTGASGFVRANWLRSMGEDDAEALPSDGGPENGTLRCEDRTCRFQPIAGGPVAMLIRVPRPKRGQEAEEVRALAYCDDATLMVSAEPIRGRCRGVGVVDRFSVWRDGAHAIWLGTDGVRVLSDRAARGDRPWVPPPPLPAWKRREMEQQATRTQ